MKQTGCLGHGDEALSPDYRVYRGIQAETAMFSRRATNKMTRVEPFPATPLVQQARRGLPDVKAGSRFSSGGSYPAVPRKLLKQSISGLRD